MSSFTLRQSVVLVGLMGAGKTTIGQRLSKTLEIGFQDSDDAIAEAAGCSIPDIFEIHGEAIFRDLEQRVIGRLLGARTPQVLATGGGAWMNPVTRQVIRQNAISVWLKADLDVLLERVSRRSGRPLLEQGDKRAILSRLMEERYPVYAEADITVESGSGAHGRVVTQIVDALKRWSGA
jgi:shikimate kinase